MIHLLAAVAAGAVLHSQSRDLRNGHKLYMGTVMQCKPLTRKSFQM